MYNFQKSKIYLIKSKSIKDRFYVGGCTTALSTEFKKLKERYYKHKYTNGVFSMFINDDAYIVLYEEFRCNNMNEYIMKLHDIRTMLNNNPPKHRIKIETTLKKIRRLKAIEEDRLENDIVSSEYDKMIFDSICLSIDEIINRSN